MWQWLRNWWWARQRATDLATLWPVCKRLAPDLDTARDVFMVHAIGDPAWARHYGAGLWNVISELE